MMTADFKNRVRGVYGLGAFLLLLTWQAAGQYGSAPAGYYPNGYGGSTFKGIVMQTSADEITLRYDNGKKTVTFTGRVKQSCYLPTDKTTTSPMPLSEVPNGSVVTAFYRQTTSKVNGKKQKVNEIIGLSFEEIKGRNVGLLHRAFYSCVSADSPMSFRAFQ